MNRILKSFVNSKQQPLIEGAISGLYPLIFYYSNNFTLINSWLHLLFFILIFIILPSTLFFLIYILLKRNNQQKRYLKIRVFFNISFFGLYLVLATYAGFHKKWALIVIILAFVITHFLHKHFKKIIAFQIIIALVGIFSLTGVMYSYFTTKNDWVNQPDDILKTEFKIRPNVYFIQPDGLTNFSELKDFPYSLETRDFEFFLEKNNFKNYKSFRSNYASTLATNSAVFTMKHHYYDNMKNFDEGGWNARDIIIGKNPTLEIFKSNGYQTNFISESAYLLLNRPEVYFDSVNFSFTEIPLFGTGFEKKKNILPILKKSITKPFKKPQFYFIELFNPGHIESSSKKTEGKEKEKEKWETSLMISYKKMSALINIIQKDDPNSLIIIMADHGGFVGLNSTSDTFKKIDDFNLKKSIFSSQLSIKWPADYKPKFDKRYISSVNFFRIFFAELSNNQSLLENLQLDESFVILEDGMYKGVYLYIDSMGSSMFKKHIN